MDIFERDRAGTPVSLEDPDYGVTDAIIREAHQLSAELNMRYMPPTRCTNGLPALPGRRSTRRCVCDCRFLPGLRRISG